METKQFQRALEDCNRGMTIAPTNRLRVLRGQVYAKSGQLNRALDDLTDAITLDGADVNAWYVRGWVHALCGRADAALSDVTKAIELEPNSPNSYELRAHILRYRGEKCAQMKTILKRNNCEPGDEVQFADKYTHIWERSEFTDFKGGSHFRRVMLHSLLSSPWAPNDSHFLLGFTCSRSASSFRKASFSRTLLPPGAGQQRDDAQTTDCKKRFHLRPP